MSGPSRLFLVKDVSVCSVTASVVLVEELFNGCAPSSHSLCWEVRTGGLELALASITQNT